MAKQVKYDLDHPRDVAAAALEFLIFDRFERVDGVFMWKNEEWKYTGYKVKDQSGLIIRIDMRKK